MKFSLLIKHNERKIFLQITQKHMDSTLISIYFGSHHRFPDQVVFLHKQKSMTKI